MLLETSILVILSLQRKDPSRHPIAAGLWLWLGAGGSLFPLSLFSSFLPLFFPLALISVFSFSVLSSICELGLLPSMCLSPIFPLYLTPSYSTRTLSWNLICVRQRKCCQIHLPYSIPFPRAFAQALQRNVVGGGNIHHNCNNEYCTEPFLF